LATDARTHEMWAGVRAQHPRFVDAVVEDARIFSAYRGDDFEFRSRREALVRAVRLCIVTDAFFALCCYRAKARCQTHQLPLLPELLHHLALVTGQICIGDPVVIRPGVYVPHGQIVIDGITEIDNDVVLSPFISIGLVAHVFQGPRIGHGVQIGTGARVLGPITIGDGAVVGANAVVVKDVDPKTTVVGVPARPIP
jgi:serine O-acetyltransferase